MSVNFGTKRVVVGAHYGTTDWIAQRLSGALMGLFTIVLLVQLLFASGPIGYEQWAGIFATQWMRLLTFATVVALLWHAWVGMRSIAMDYVKADGLRLGVYGLILLWLLGCAGWALQVLWRL